MRAGLPAGPRECSGQLQTGCAQGGREVGGDVLGSRGGAGNRLQSHRVEWCEEKRMAENGTDGNGVDKHEGK